jgi:hypothetical protein
MAQQVFIAYKKELKDIAATIGKQIFSNSMIEIGNDGLISADLYTMARKSFTEFFYVINSDTEILFTNLDFSFKPPKWDKHLIHIWNNDLTVKLYNKEMVLNNPDLYTDAQLASGNVELKNITDKIFEYHKLDIVFISYDEDNADAHYEMLKNRFPAALRSHGVKGIYEAHLAAARIASTRLFYAVDADAIIDPAFDFSYYPNGYDINSVHVWYSHNPVNDLIYGYGGVKLFPRHLLLDYTGSPLDFTTSVSTQFKVMPTVSNITQFNTDPFSAWRSGFRECTKLSSKLIANHNNAETEERLHTWCTKGSDREFGEFAIMGANEGCAFGKAHKDQPDMLGLINDFDWLAKKFSS